MFKCEFMPLIKLNIMYNTVNIRVHNKLRFAECLLCFLNRIYHVCQPKSLNVFLSRHKDKEQYEFMYTFVLCYHNL